MQRGRSGRDEFFGFGDPFAGFGGFGRPGGLISNVFGGRDPFDDPFFTQPFGGMMGPSFFGRSMFGAGGSPFGDTIRVGSLEDQAPQPKSKGPVIEELSSDYEQEKDSAEEKDNRRKHFRPDKEPYIQDPDEEMDGDAIGMYNDGDMRCMQQRTEYERANPSKPQTQTYSFHSSSVTYGGHNGAYYTSSTTRKAGGDGVIVEESREADATTGKATHKISRGLGNKGHSVTRKLGSDGRVDTVQTLHNLDEHELSGFEEAWKGNAKNLLPGWNQGLEMPSDRHRGRRGMQTAQSSRGWALPAAEKHQYTGHRESQAHPHQFFSN